VRIGGVFPFRDGERQIKDRQPALLREILDVIASVKAPAHKTKVSKEKTMNGRMLFNPKSLNVAFKAEFHRRGWAPVRVPCVYSQKYYREAYAVRSNSRGAFREMDFVKDKVGVEVQLGKYAFMVYNVCAKMTIFHNLKHINYGVEIVPMKDLADEMSTGVSFFEQIVWDLEARGESEIDIPVVVLGITQ
jgi:hypothetical protein